MQESDTQDQSHRLLRLNDYPFDAGERLSSIRVPTLLASAQDDALVPAYLTRQLAAAIPQARVHEVGWGAHAFTVVTPNVFNDALLGFCKEVDGR